MIAIRDLEMTKERLLSFAEYAKDAQPEVLVTLIQTIVERIYIVDFDKMKMVCQPRTKNQRRNQVQMKLDVNSLAHTKWECKYHIVFAPKYRRQEIYGKIKQDIGQMLRKLCEYKGIEIHEAEASKDHIHMLVSIPPKYSVSQIMGYLKGKSSLMIYEKYANLKYKYGNRHFWCRGYYVSTVGRNRRAIEEYIKNQLQEDYTDDQLSIKEFVDPFTGEPVKGGK